MNENKSIIVEKNMQFDDFNIGDYIYFEKSFNFDDYRKFETLSGDSNPLHSNEDYAKLTKYKKRILPLHLTISPLSAIAGMIFPGKPSLYLGHEIQAIKAVYFDEKLIYSAKITSINQSIRVLTIRVLVLRNTEIVVDAEMRVQSLEQTWSLDMNSSTIYNNNTKGYALITGATGEIGQAVAVNLAKLGWNLLLQDRGSEIKRKLLRNKLQPYKVKVEFFNVDLTNIEDRFKLKDKIIRSDYVYDLVVHIASSDVDSSLDSLIATNYSSIKELNNAILPRFLLKQSGTIINVSSIYVAKNVLGWEDYTAAKTMTANYINGINQHYSKYGIKALTIYPGVVMTNFSKKYRGDTSGLLPEEVAETIIEMLDSNESIAYEVNYKKNVTLGLHDSIIKEINIQSKSFSEPKSYVEEKIGKEINFEKVKLELLNLIGQKLKLHNTDNLVNGGIDVTPGWDSLAQIDIIVAIEAKFGFSFNSHEITELKDFQSLYKKVLKEV